MVSQDLFQGVLGEKESLLLVQWFSGFSGMLFCCAGFALLLLKLFGVKINSRRIKQGGGR
jgi:hypothetical protein